jgi:hypothetical protein
VGVAVDPAGQFLYVLATDGDGDFFVHVYSIDPNSGALTEVPGSPYSTQDAGANGLGVNQNIAVHPSGKFVAVTNGQSNLFTIFAANGSGVLTKLSDQSGQGLPQSLLFDATGTHLYDIESESGFLNSFQFNSQTGALSFISNQVAPTIPGDATIDPTGQFFLEISVADDANLTGSVVVFPIDPATGELSASTSTTTVGFDTMSIASVAENVAAQFPTVTPIPDAADYTPTPVGTSATPINVVINNFGTAPLTFTAIAISGANPGDFALGSATTCAAGVSIPAAGSCILSVLFTPTVVATRTATLTIIDNANPATQFVPLSGNGTAATATATLIPASVTFPSTVVNASSGVVTSTVTNSGNVPLIFTSISVAGTNPGDFAIDPTTTCSVQLRAGEPARSRWYSRRRPPGTARAPSHWSTMPLLERSRFRLPAPLRRHCLCLALTPPPPHFRRRH